MQPKLDEDYWQRKDSPKHLYGISSHEGTNTTNYSVLERHGNVVAVTYTINSYFGAGVIAVYSGFFPEQ